MEQTLGFKRHYNIGSEQRGTAIIRRENIEIHNILKIPSGRAIAAEFQGTRIVNIYAPSGAEKRQERERFFNQDITHLLRTTTGNLIIAGDFNP